MSQKTRSKGKNQDSLLEKVRQLSPLSHAPLNILNTVSNSLNSTTETSILEERNGLLHGNVGLAQIHQLILEVKESLDGHKETVSQEINKLNDNFQRHLNEEIFKLSDTLKTHMKDSIVDIQQYVDIEVGKVNCQLQDIQVRVSAIEEQQQ